MARYDPKQVEPKWRAAWEEAGVDRARDDAPGPKYNDQEMFA